MSATGIGASVKRKEDIRFITGKGRYVDDINRPGQAYAFFVRSPHAHATIDKIDASAALKSPGVAAVLTGADAAADKIGAHIGGVTVHSKDGSPMKVGSFPALAHGKALYVGDPVAVIIANSLAQAKDAAEKVVVDYGVLPAVIETAHANQPGQPQVHEFAPGNTVFNWHLGDKAPTDAAFTAAKHVTKLDLVNNRTIPNAMEPRAALGDYDEGTDVITLHTTSQKSPSRASRPVRVPGRRAGEQTARHRARRGRRVRIKNLYIQRGDGLRLGGEEDQSAGEMDGRTNRVVSDGRSWSGPCHACRTGA